jgi:hypothetical protein
MEGTIENKTEQQVKPIENVYFFFSKTNNTPLVVPIK